jgi:hypothetical protein
LWQKSVDPANHCDHLTGDNALTALKVSLLDESDATKGIKMISNNTGDVNTNNNKTYNV